MFDAYDLFSKLCVDTIGRKLTENEFNALVNSKKEYKDAISDEVAFMRVAPDMLAGAVHAAPSALPFKYDASAFRGISYVKHHPEYADVLQKLLPSIALSVTEDEQANWTYNDLYVYLIDNVTVSGHTAKEQAIVDGIKAAYTDVSGRASGVVSPLYVRGLHTALMRNVLEDTSQLGCIRTREVLLKGVSNWKQVPVEQLQEVFDREAAAVNAIADTLERAVVAMMWLQYRQFFYDGNKRVARLMCNDILGSEKAGVFCTPRPRLDEYRQLLADFYETADATSIIKYTLEHCLAYFPDGETTHWPE